MKILQLKFKNINSLAGEWTIDFTLPQFADNGIFAISGKTGSGKSSILDAVSLALFGKTPRVEITGANNDVMTRNTNDCYSEIVFEVNGKTWKSAWKQERTRTGNLKAVNRQIADANNKILADQVRACDSKIVEILGLTFEQFTKVILLAQGGFAAFLQADKNDKGELLEQITGTEIYGEISKKVFERSKAEKEKLDKICIELGAIKMLSCEEKEILQNEISEIQKQKSLIDNEIQQIETAKKQLIDLVDLAKQIDETKKKLPELQQSVEIAKTAFEQAEEKLKKVKGEKEIAEKILLKVRELDTKIEEKNKLLNPVLKTLNELKENQLSLTKNFENKQNELVKTQKTFNEKKEWADKHAKFALLVEQYSAIEQDDLQVNNFLKDLNAKQKEFETAQTDLQKKIADLQNANTTFTEKENALKLKNQELEARKAELAKLLQGKDLAYYQQEKINIVNFGTQLNELIHAEKAIAKNQQEIREYAAVISSCESLEKDLLGKISENKTALEKLENQVKLLEENISLTKTIQSLEQHRRSLEDGKACPLCGSKEHPFAMGNVPQMAEKEAELKNLKKEIQAISNTISTDEKAQTKSTSDKDNSLKNKAKEEQSLSENKAKQTSILHEISDLQSDFSIPETENRIEFLQTIYLKKHAEYKQINATIEQAAAIEKAVKNMQEKELPDLQTTKETADKAKTTAETQKQLAEQETNTKHGLFSKSQTDYQTKKAELKTKFAHYNVEDIISLKKYLNNWLSNQNEIKKLSEQIGELRKEIALQQAIIEHNKTQLETKTKEGKDIQTDKQKLLEERIELFGNKQVAEEEQRLKQLLDNAEASKTKAEKIKTEASTEYAKSQAVIAEKEKELATKQAQKITEKTLEELQSEHDEKKPLSDQLSQTIGANQKALTDNEENLKNNDKKLKEREIQKEIYNQWAGLNELIGSQDGKKYRNFVQVLTFEHLISLANKQLQKMSERYILKRVGDASNPFELSVIDKFQNCEERTAQNLSGGEKFIASLSLALGLANMASKNMKIDTMFIDEGFGTLDSDYLDTALSALSNLQNEGKLIGVISHLTELKERIATHIEVIPTGNGHSKIEIVA